MPARSVMVREAGKPASAMPYISLSLMRSQIQARHIADARQTLALALPGWRRHGQTVRAAGAMAVLCADLGLWADATRLSGASLAAAGNSAVWQDPRFSHETAQWHALLPAAPCPAADIERWLAEGQRLDEAAIAAIGKRVAAVPA